MSSATAPGLDAAARASACEACGSERVRLLRHSETHDFDVGRCPDCGMVYVLDPPAPQAVEDSYVSGTTENVEDYVDWQREDTSVDDRVLAHLEELLRGQSRSRPTLFDVGAGVGDFVMLARQHGFEVTGNEIAPSAIEYTRERHGLELSPLPLAEQPPESVDAITMWCIIAHVPDPEAFAREAFAMLRPGGVLFLRTPRWCLIDTVGIAADRLTRGRLHHVADRRITPAHLHLFNAETIGMTLRAAGFSDIDVQEVCHYPLTAHAYLDTMGGSGRLLGPIARALDALIERDWFVRNTLLVYARRPQQPR